MASKPKLQTKTPDEPELNSFITTHEELIQAPRERRFAIVEIGVPKVELLTEGDSVAQYRLLHVEEIRPGKDQDAVLAIRDRIYSARTGNKTPPAPHHDTPLDLPGDEV